MTREEAIRRIKTWNLESDDMEVLSVLIPELKESKDERIKNLLYCLIRDRSGIRKLLECNGVSVDMALAWIEKQGEQKSTWSEDDEHRLKDTIYFLDTAKKHYADITELDACINWLKSLKPQSHWKPNDEQMEALLYEVNAWDEDSVNGQNLRSLYQDLKKIK